MSQPLYLFVCWSLHPSISSIPLPCYSTVGAIQLRLLPISKNFLSMSLSRRATFTVDHSIYFISHMILKSLTNQNWQPSRKWQVNILESPKEYPKSFYGKWQACDIKQSFRGIPQQLFDAWILNKSIILWSIVGYWRSIKYHGWSIKGASNKFEQIIRGFLKKN